MSLAMYNLLDTPAMPLSEAHFGGFFVVAALQVKFWVKSGSVSWQSLSHQKTEQRNYVLKIKGFLSHE